MAVFSLIDSLILNVFVVCLCPQIIKKPKDRSSMWISSSVPAALKRKPELKQCSTEYQVNNFLKPVLFYEAVKVCYSIIPWCHSITESKLLNLNCEPHLLSLQNIYCHSMFISYLIGSGFVWQEQEYPIYYTVYANHLQIIWEKVSFSIFHFSLSIVTAI